MSKPAPIQVSDYNEQQAIEKFWRSIKRNLDADQRADFATYGGEGGFPPTRTTRITKSITTAMKQQFGRFWIITRKYRANGKTA